MPFASRDREYRYVAREGLGAGFWQLMLSAALTVVFLLLSYLLLSYMLRWGVAASETMGPENIQMLSRQANERWAALEQMQYDIRDLEQQVALYPQLYGENTATWPQGKAEEYQQLQQQLTNRRTAYRRECAAYQAMWRDEWRSIPAPDDLPQTCPAL